jgi:hypothetical protein
MSVGPWLAVVAMTGSVVAADAARAAQQATIEVVGKRGVISAPATPAVGAGFISGGELFDKAGTTRVGQGFSHCAIVQVTVDVPPAARTHCTSTFSLADGELHLSSMRTYKTFAAGYEQSPFAIIGGTGAYANARGEGKAVRESTGPDVTYRFTFNVETD